MPDFFALRGRVRELMEANHASAYQRKKSKLECELEQFLGHLGKAIVDCGPEEICMFLVLKDKAGKTPVHYRDCSAVGDRKPVCGCPRKLAFGTVLNKVSQLKAIFTEKGVMSFWQGPGGNPVDSTMVKVFCEADPDRAKRGSRGAEAS